MKKFLSTAAACVLIGSSIVIAPPAVGAPTETPKLDHKPGWPGYGVDLPADTADTVTGQTHACAGRKLLYQSHVDAIYGTRKAGELTTMVVDGQQVTDADKICVRLAPDANEDGDEVSRLVVPADDPGLGFLGEPGTILWYAPQMVPFRDKWRPVWAGQGAFDPAHEYNVPTDFVNNELTFELSKFDGPGDVEMFFYNAAQDAPDRRFSTKDPALRQFQSGINSHGHYNWTFTKPGIYHFTWTLHVQKTDGTKEDSKPVTTTWLVGTDEDVHLPEGTTIDLQEIKRSADDLRNEQFGPPTEEPTEVPTEEPTEAPEPTDAEPKPSQPTRPTQSTSAPKPVPEPAPSSAPALVDPAIAKTLSVTNPSALITEGHMDMALEGSASNATVVLHDDSVAGTPISRESGTFAFAVPDTAKNSAIPGAIQSSLGIGSEAWVLPQAQQQGLPWPGFSTQAFDYSTIDSSGVTVRISDFDGPGRLVTSHSGISGTEKLLDSDDPNSSLNYPMTAHDHQAMFFTKPGAYRVTFSYQASGTSGENVNEEITTYFLVGDNAVSDGTKIMNGQGTSTGSKSDPESERIGLLLGGSVIAWKLWKEFGNGHKNEPEKAQKSTATAKPAAPNVKAEPKADSKPDAKQGPAAPVAPAAPAAPAAPVGKAAAPAPAPAPLAAPKAAPKALASTSTAKPSARASVPNASSPVQQQAAPQPVQVETQPVASTNALTSGGWLAGFVLGIGLMALLGGLGLFVATAKTLRRMQQPEALED